MAESSKESSKRSWPWKKKAQEKASSSSTPDSVESSPRASPHNARFGDEQDVSKILSGHARVSEEAMQQWLHSESKLKQVNEQLQGAQSELTNKDVLVKQHAKVAEEAVTGWEKAESEAAALKQQLDTTTHQKLATEDRVSHLDGALKECMKQLRHVREEQEQRIHETIVKKTREYDSLRQEMEAKLGEVGRHLQDARTETIDARAEACVLSSALEDSSKALGEVNDSRARTEGEMRILQGRLESAEKECASSKYELQVMKRELEIRTEEIESERKVTENAGKNQIENVKKIAKLEAECHKLRILVRQKLPGPAALAQMKAEVGALERSTSTFDPKRRRSLSSLRSVSSTSPRDQARHPDGSLGSPRDSDSERSGQNREAEILAERLMGMDDELKMLKEALARRDGELQESRLMCAKTASKLSDSEQQLQHALKRGKRKSDGAAGRSTRKTASVGGAGDAWDAASALLVELDQVKKASDKGLDVGKLDLMDDFAELERLAMTTEKDEVDIEADCDDGSEASFSAITAACQEKLVAKDKELEDSNQKCREVSQQLQQAQVEVAALQSRNRANEAGLVTLQEKLDKFSDKTPVDEEDGQKDRKITKELEDLVEAQSISIRSGAHHEAMLYDLEDGSQNGGDANDNHQRSPSSRSSSEVKYELNEELASVLSDADSKSIIVGSDLLTAVRKVVRVVAVLVDATVTTEQGLSSVEMKQQHGCAVQEGPTRHFMECKNPDLYSGMQSLIGISNKLLQGKTDVVEFLAELAAVLSSVINVIFRARKVRQLGDGMPSPAPAGKELANGKGIGMGNEVEDHRRLSSGKASSLGSLSHGEMAFGISEDGSPRPKASPVEIVSNGLHSSFKSLDDDLSNHVREPESPNFDGARSSNERSGSGFEEWSISNSELGKDMLMLHKKVSVLEGELQGERRRHQEVVLKYLDLHQQIRSTGAGGGSNSASSAGSRTKDGAEWDSVGSQHQHQSPEKIVGDIRSDVRAKKDREMAEKLAECQRSILDLGKQLHALSTPLPGESIDALSDTACSMDRASRSSNELNSGLQLRGHDSDSANTAISDLRSRTYSNRSRLEFSPREGGPGVGEYSVPSSPFVDHRRSSLSPTPSLVRRDGRGPDL